MDVLVFTEIDDERTEITLNGHHIIETNHDDHGWDGMEAIQLAFERAAAIVGWKVEER